MKASYIHIEDVHNTKAAEVVVPLVLDFASIKSVLDIGCGIGTWLKVFNDYGINDIIGVDGDYVNRTQLLVDNAQFIAHNLTQPLLLKREFDLVLSLEVAEHLPEEAADIFVQTLVKHGKTILFSAAIPGQGGQNHLNEQWPSYWQEKFRKYGYEYYDIIRPQVWDNKNVDVWYRQNMFLLFHESKKPDFSAFKNDNLIHPDYWLRIESLRNHLNDWKNGEVGIANTWRAYQRSVRKKLKKLIIK